MHPLDEYLYERRVECPPIKLTIPLTPYILNAYTVPQCQLSSAPRHNMCTYRGLAQRPRFGCGGWYSLFGARAPRQGHQLRYILGVFFGNVVSS